MQRAESKDQQWDGENSPVSRWNRLDACAVSDALDKLGFFADVGNGIFYFLAHTINPAGPDVSRAVGDYGTRLIATGGVLNFLCVLEAVHLALRRAGEGNPG